ncbi:unnamed protein product [Eruca vesicaria subsp. sativa]|uniref:Jacalin-type lectin domain-containing protein n=1 Tax=Eruca vesicaria subsp. sativa TaxID=29727 RepID=A0ABC8KR43_ERUVS|nr:unnamed protein product [Eruca vesicaria subsp. sativa]
MIQKLDAQGSFPDIGKWDDGSDHDGVSKIYIGCGIKGIRCIYFDYVKSGKSIEGTRHGFPVYMAEINLLENEHLESVSGTYVKDEHIYSLVFKSNFKTIGPIMPMDENSVPGETKDFTLAVKGKKIIGFHGSSIYMVKSLGAYFTWITPTRVEAKDGKGGKKWDDEYNHEDVSMIHVRGGYGGIQSIQFDYVTNGELKKGPVRGVSNGGFTSTYEINYLNDEYLVFVEGYYDDGLRVIQGIQFRTNIRTFEMMGYAKGRKFTLEDNGNKITGFHGYADKRALISIGAYFTPATPCCKLECIGQPGDGLRWDDGAGYDGIRKVFVAAPACILSIRFEYEHRGKVIKTRFRGESEEEVEFVIDYPNEFITSVEGSLEGIRVTSLTVKTSKGRTSPKFGFRVTSDKFVLEKPGHVLVGFHGSSDYYLLALGAYYRPLPPPPDTVKIEEEGGDGGDYWDDGGAFNGIRKIYIGLTENNTIDDHGNKSVLYDLQELTLSDPAEYLTSVEGDYDDESGVITMLKFTTNNNSRVFGFSTTTSFILHKDKHKIVGFHGKSSNMLHQIGVHVLPIP